MELYEERAKEKGKRRADLNFIKDVLLLFRPSIIKPADGTYRINNYGILKNYFKVSWRNLKRQKSYSIINIGGLSIGLACFILIFLYIQHELSYDKFFANWDRIYRVYNAPDGNDFLGKNKSAVTPAPLARALMNDHPEVEYATTFDPYQMLLELDEEHHFWEYGVSADPNFFNVFPYTFIEGHPETALNHPQTLVLTASFAAKVFGDKSPLGKSLIYREKSFQISAVVQDPPSNSSLNFSFVINIESSRGYQEEMKRSKWGGNGYKTFFTVKSNTNVRQLEGKMPELIEKYWIDPVKYPQKYVFEPLSEVHLQNDLNFDVGVKGSRKQLVLFSVVALLVLALASINYTNLALARSVNRAKEVGLRKTIGARKGQLSFQFLCEAILLSFFALILSLALVALILPVFGRFVGRSLELDLLQNVSLIPWLFLLTVVIGVIAGSYPALFMSSLRPVKVLKGNSDGPLTGKRIQRWLIIGQYFVSIAMIICSLIIYQQFEFINQKELGFQKDQILTIRARSSELRENIEIIKSEWLKNPNILAVAGSQNLPSNIQQSTIVNDEKGGSPDDDLSIYQLRADYDFLELYGLELIAGRYFSRDFADSLNVCVINENAAQSRGWTAQEAVGKVFTDDWRHGDRKIIGVIKDFHMHSLHLPMAPLLIELSGSRHSRFISVKIHPENIRETIAQIEETVNEHSSYPFDAQFLDDRLSQLYQEDMSSAKIFGFFTILAILIASLGLFGLAAFSTHQRIKEIGIRKVLGASISGIASMVSQDFLKMVVIGFILAAPVAWFGMKSWLDGFAYHTPVHWWLFGLAGGSALIIALVTISSQSLKAAMSNPVDCLHDE